MVKYPITPDYILKAPMEAVRLYADLEDVMLRDICERLKYNNGELTGTAIRELEKLKLRGYDTKKIAKAIEKLTSEGEAAAQKAISDTIAANIDYYKLIYDAVGEGMSSDFGMAEIEALERQAMDNFHNITGSYGFSIRRLDGTVQWMSPSKAYQEVLDHALFKAQSGSSYSQCIRGAVSELTSSGITTVEYYKEDGVKKSHRNRIDVAVRRAIQTGVTQISSKFADMAMEDLDTDYLYVTQHQGARDTGIGWQNHESWQGLVYSKKSGDKYPSVYEVCGLDQVDGLGLCGINCRHSYYPYFEGISEVAEKMPKKKSSYKGKQYTAYEASQVLRKMETQMRDLKRKMIGESASGDKEKYLKHAAKHRALKEEYADFAKATGQRSQYYERAGILQWGPKQAQEAEKALLEAGS